MAELNMEQDMRIKELEAKEDEMYEREEALREEVAGLVVEKEKMADKRQRLLQEVCGHLADKANLLEKVRALEKELETVKNKYKRSEAIFSQIAEANEATIQEYLNKNLKLESELKEKDTCCLTPICMGCLTPICMGATNANWCDECIKMPGRSQHASYPFKRIPT